MRDERARALARLWLAKATRDLHGAEDALKREYVEGTAFHVQQALEKTIKAMLIARGVRPPRTHDLAMLAALLELRIDLTAEFLRNATSWAVQARYVDDEFIPPQLSEVEAALRLAAMVLSQAEKEIG